MRGWLEWLVGGLWKRRRVILVLLGITAAFTALVLFQNRDYRPEATMEDPAFIDAANTLCAKTIPGLRAVPREGETEDDLAVETADQIDRVLPKLTTLVGDLRTLDAQPASEAQLQAWFGDFDDYIAAGRAYSAALRTGKDDVYDKVDDQAVQPLKNISHFARANKIDSCIP